MMYTLNPRNYTKYINYIMQKKKKKLQRFTHQKKTLMLKKNQINFVKNQKKICLSPLCDLSKLIFYTIEYATRWNGFA
jgi:hypothetical protein